MDRVRFALFATLLGFASFVGCGTDSAGGGSGTTPEPPPIPEHECGGYSDCEEKFDDLSPCEDAVCAEGVCIPD